MDNHTRKRIEDLERRVDALEVNKEEPKVLEPKEEPKLDLDAEVAKLSESNKID
jgi:hypothetical protein